MSNPIQFPTPTTKKQTNKKLVTELTAGDVIDPPAGEKVWLWRDGVKRRYTVQRIEHGKTTRRGAHTRIYATCPSPYSDRIADMTCQMLNTKIVTLRNA